MKAISSIMGPQGLMHQHLPHYEPRMTQQIMAQHVLACLQHDSKLIVEAGTGTGKTLAYLLPTMLEDHKVVVSTGTKTLQEQLMRKDIPVLLEALGLDREVALMKGLGNYLCLRRLAEIRRQATLFPHPDLPQLVDWAQRTTTGDRSELHQLTDTSTLWPEVCAGPETRLGPRCAFFEECFITRMRRSAAAARLVVVNHHLLLADLALRQHSPEASVIPPFAALIIDEAHQLEAIATTFFSQSLSSSAISSLVRDVHRAAKLSDDPAADRLAIRLEGCSAELFFLLPRELPRLESTLLGPSLNQKTIKVRLEHEPLAGSLLEPYFQLDSALEALGAHLQARASGHEELSLLAQRTMTMRETAAVFADPVPEGYLFWAEKQQRSVTLYASPIEVGHLLRTALLSEPFPIVFTSATLSTVEEMDSRSDTTSRSQRATPANATAVDPRSISRGEVARQLNTSMPTSSVLMASGAARRTRVDVLGPERALALADQGIIPKPIEVRSAADGERLPLSPDPRETPAVRRSFAFFRQRTGLIEVEDVEELVLPSPFCFPEQVLLYVPRDVPQPQHTDFIIRASERMTQLIDITGGRALVLFTSYKNLEAARHILHRQLEYPILCQGDKPRTLLLETFRQQVTSILLATTSFWEGVDVVGESLSLVIMDKLPFAVPSDPLTAARLEQLEAQGCDPFLSYQLPQAALHLKQGFGRLIRHRRDRGIVAVLDRRLIEKPYGVQLRACLPPCPITSDLLRVRAFCKEVMKLR